MNAVAFNRAVASLLALLCLAGCSPQKSLAKRLQVADRLVVTNSHEDFSMSVQGEDLTMIVQALVSAQKVKPGVDASPGLSLEFFKGEEHLESILTSAPAFWIGSNPYVDRSGTLNGLYLSFRRARALKPTAP